jgi:hypothetical protein
MDIAACFVSHFPKKRLSSHFSLLCCLSHTLSNIAHLHTTRSAVSNARERVRWVRNFSRRPRVVVMVTKQIKAMTKEGLPWN